MIDNHQMDEYQEPTLRKQIKQEDPEQTQRICTHLRAIDNTKIDQNQVNFISQRERFNYLNDPAAMEIDYPLPQIFKLLWNKFKQIDFNLWKKNLLILSDVDVLRVRQLLNLEKLLFKIKVIQNSLELKFSDSAQENLPPHHQNPNSLPVILQQRQKIVKNLLSRQVQQRHSQYLIKNNIVNFNEYQSLKTYHQDYPLEEQEDIEPITIDLMPPLISALMNESLKQTMNKIYSLYERRGVSFMFTENLKTHIREDIKHLEYLYKLIPDLIKQQNQITQINRALDIQTIYKRLDLISR